MKEIGCCQLGVTQGKIHNKDNTKNEELQILLLIAIHLAKGLICIFRWSINTNIKNAKNLSMFRLNDAQRS